MAAEAEAEYRDVRHTQEEEETGIDKGHKGWQGPSSLAPTSSLAPLAGSQIADALMLCPCMWRPATPLALAPPRSHGHHLRPWLAPEPETLTYVLCFPICVKDMRVTRASPGATSVGAGVASERDFFPLKP